MDVESSLSAATNGANQRCAIITTAATASINSASTLNDDCLVEIFKRMKVAELMDLCRFCDHCLHLIKSYTFTERQIDFAALKGEYNVQQVLACFGGTASSLAIHRGDIERTTSEKSDSEELLEMLTTHCDANVLKRLNLTLNYDDIDSAQIVAFSAKLKNIHNLNITASRYGARHRKLSSAETDHQIETLVQNSVSIQTLHLKMFSISATFLHRSSLEHLTELSFVQCDQIQAEALMQSADYLTNLKHFEWKNSKFNGIAEISANISTLCQILGQQFPHLSQVTVHMNYGLNYCHRNDDSVLNGLCKLANLENLSIGIAGACACNNFFGCIQRLDHLKKLAIESPIIFGGRQCLPCKKIISNYLPRVFCFLPHLRSLRIGHVSKDDADLLDRICDQLPDIQELHLNGYRKMNEEKLHRVVHKLRNLKIVNIQETRFHFSRALYLRLLDECIHSKRLLKVIVGIEMKRAIFGGIHNDYRKEYVQILDQ